MRTLLAPLALSLAFIGALVAQDASPKPDAKPPLPDLSEFKTVASAVTTRISRAAAPERSGPPAFLGIHAGVNDRGQLVVAEVAADSPAARAGVQRGDVLAKADGQEVASNERLRELLQDKGPGNAISLNLIRQEKPVEVKATLTAVSRPLTAAGPRGLLGAQVIEAKEGEGVQITLVAPGSPAAKAKLKEGETILKLDDKPVANPERLRDLLAEHKAGDTVTLTLLLADKAVDLKLKLDGEPEASATGARRGGFDFRTGGYWQKDVFRLALILIEYPDVKHNPKITAQAWGDSLFSRDTYKTTATGQPAFGSMADYYHEQSFGKLKVEGKAFEHIEVGKKRAEYGEGNNRAALLTEALDKIIARDGKDALKDFDGLCFVYMGGRMNVARGSLYWPHRASVNYQGKRWPYFICCEGGERMGNTSVYCHEFGHMLGLPDLYARPENPGSEGVGVWCAMSNQAPNGRPQHFSAWSKEKLGWITPCVIDPTMPQKLILAPVEDSPKECFKVLIRPDGSEYLLLENRRKKGFDASLPAEGLLVWRVVQNRPILEESHGVTGPSGPRVFPNAVPYPSPSNDAFTPFTQPSSRSQIGGGLAVHLTSIRQLPDGRITFCIGYEYE